MQSTTKPIIVLVAALALPLALFVALAATSQVVVPIEPVPGIVEEDTFERVILEPRPPADTMQVQPTVSGQARFIAVLPDADVR
ncbi:MAG: hypothetical protein QNJ90_08055 [Planctomycetota bacterium]|nr:hypothetical protein [Planctomycetota bacterium]